MLDLIWGYRKLSRSSRTTLVRFPGRQQKYGFRSLLTRGRGPRCVVGLLACALDLAIRPDRFAPARAWHA